MSPRYKIVITCQTGLPSVEIVGSFLPTDRRHVDLAIHHALQDLAFKRRMEMGRIVPDQGTTPNGEKENEHRSVGSEDSGVGEETPNSQQTEEVHGRSGDSGGRNLGPDQGNSVSL